MTSKLRPIRTTSRAASVKRSDVASAAKAVIISRDAESREYVGKVVDRKALDRSGIRNKGRITSRFIGGGHKSKHREIDFKRDKRGIPAKVAAIEYDVNRTAFIALLDYIDGEKRYIFAPKGLSVGTMIMADDNAEIAVGNALPLAKIPVGTVIHNIELKEGKGGQIARSAGAGAQVIARKGDWVTLRLPSGELRKVHARCYATVGQVGHAEDESGLHPGSPWSERTKSARNQLTTKFIKRRTARRK